MLTKFWLNFFLIFAVFNLVCFSPVSAQIKNIGKLNQWTSHKIARSDGKEHNLKIVRMARNVGFDRIVFEFEAGTTPFETGFIKRPIYYDELEEKPENEVEINGQAVFQIRFYPATTDQLDSGGIQHRKNLIEENTNHKSNLGILQDVRLTDSWEGSTTFTIGLKKPRPFRVSSLQNPARLILDFKH